ncbi:MAG: manganese/zinc/iron transport system substrate-binding protein [Halomonas sp. HL-48]|nr:zinc ABC transporter substrate-binding protein [Halomonas sp. HL-48]KPQ24205.1 MAG: manganese/zinc/iron transport system substrate-binding protein [Halomonas sp. HL-48]
MRNKLINVGSLLVALLLASAPAVAESPLRVVTSFSVIADLVKRVAGDNASVDVIVPPGEDVHRWELNPPNVLALEETDLVFYNGFDLEPWLRDVQAIVEDELPMVALAEHADYPTLPLTVGRYENSANPHMWMAPQGAAAYVDVIVDTLSAHAPDHAEAFGQRADELKETLEELDAGIRERLGGIPQTNRSLVTSEAGVAYFADAYDFEYTALWGVNHETLGKAAAMARLQATLADKRPPALFYESTTPKIHMDAQARYVDLPLAGPLYVDALSGSDGPAADYVAMLRHNTELLHAALGGAREDD